MLLLFLSCTLTLLGVLSLSYSIMSFTYVMASWVYLRFYQIRADGTRGDMSDNFSFASFFPEPIQWVAKSVCVFHTTFHSQPQIYFHTIVFPYHIVVCDRACNNQPCECKNHPFFSLLYHNLLTFNTNTTNSLPLQQNLMGFFCNLQKQDATFITEDISGNITL